MSDQKYVMFAECNLRFEGDVAQLNCRKASKEQRRSKEQWTETKQIGVVNVNPTM